MTQWLVCSQDEKLSWQGVLAPSSEHGKGRREHEKQGGGRSSGVKRKLERMRREGVWGTVLLLVSNSTHGFFFFLEADITSCIL